jgi:hypothetical protein
MFIDVSIAVDSYTYIDMFICKHRYMYIYICGSIVASDEGVGAIETDKVNLYSRFYKI